MSVRAASMIIRRKDEGLSVSGMQVEEQNPNTIAPEIYSSPVLLKDVLNVDMQSCSDVI
jgi:hypothetical protein